MPIQPNFLERTAIFNLNLVPGVLLDVGGALAFQALALAAQMGLFGALAERPSTPTELAQKLHSHERGTESLLQALVAIGYVVERYGRSLHQQPATPRWLGWLLILAAILVPPMLFERFLTGYWPNSPVLPLVLAGAIVGVHLLFHQQLPDPNGNPPP